MTQYTNVTLVMALEGLGNRIAALEDRVAELETQHYQESDKRTAQNVPPVKHQEVDHADPWESEPHAPTRPRPRNECTCTECMEPGLR